MSVNCNITLSPVTSITSIALQIFRENKDIILSISKDVIAIHNEIPPEYTFDRVKSKDQYYYKNSYGDDIVFIHKELPSNDKTFTFIDDKGNSRIFKISERLSEAKRMCCKHIM